MPGIDGNGVLKLYGISTQSQGPYRHGHSTLGITEDLKQAGAMDLLGDALCKVNYCGCGE